MYQLNRIKQMDDDINDQNIYTCRYKISVKKNIFGIAQVLKFSQLVE